MKAQRASRQADQHASRPSYDVPRPLAMRTRGRGHGPITRLASPGDLGQLLKPFVFLDLFDIQPTAVGRGFDMHPHSGIATLTYLMHGEVGYEDTTGKKGVLPAGGVEWMRAGNGVWHSGLPVGIASARGFQLWVALPPAEENAPAQSMYLPPDRLPVEGPATVLLGRYGSARSPIPIRAEMTYLAVRLKDGERWRYTPPAGHSVAWLALIDGGLDVGQNIDAGELVVFEESEQAIQMLAKGDTAFVLGSAVKHPHDLVLGYYSVHTSEATLAQGEAEIRRIGDRLRRAGRLP
ncbi:pirin family protein [Xanthomonas hortorum]|uniref:pirin family protein n=1 Tax=Xanthomonas hortorum TaxID=56454 RepID=UPI002936343B|nr:pirin family protein [Xanthomonas hortorum]MDV2453250.1 pirin family protein [Xanthomonas hortorum NBC5720]